MEGHGRVGEYVGGYTDWQRQRAARRKTAPPQRPSPPSKTASASPGKTASVEPKRKLTYSQRLELEALPARVERLEGRMAELTERLNDPDLYAQPADEIRRINDEVASLQAEIDAAYATWETLEADS